MAAPYTQRNVTVQDSKWQLLYKKYVHPMQAENPMLQFTTNSKRYSQSKPQMCLNSHYFRRESRPYVFISGKYFKLHFDTVKYFGPTKRNVFIDQVPNFNALKYTSKKVAIPLHPLKTSWTTTCIQRDKIISSAVTPHPAEMPGRSPLSSAPPDFWSERSDGIAAWGGITAGFIFFISFAILLPNKPGELF